MNLDVHQAGWRAVDGFLNSLPSLAARIGMLTARVLSNLLVVIVRVCSVPDSPMVAHFGVSSDGPRRPTADALRKQSDEGRLTVDVLHCSLAGVTAAQRKVATFRLDDDLMNGLQTVYERDGILPSEQVRRAVRTWLEHKGVIPAKELGTRAEKKASKKP